LLPYEKIMGEGSHKSVCTNYNGVIAIEVEIAKGSLCALALQQMKKNFRIGG
jgi:hypothetical protein